MCRYSHINHISYYVKVMTHSKKTLQSYLMTLQAYRDTTRILDRSGRRLIYEICCLFRNNGILQKRVYFVAGHSILPDDPGCVESCWIHMLTKTEIERYEESCRKYGI